ncbi:MAG: hypothetical protein PHT77_01365 [Bacteroidales bacterium]|nr:hypothetical protein [Bacteroidales bacterium]
MIDTIKFEIPKLINPINLTNPTQKSNDSGELILERYNLENLRVTLNYFSRKTYVEGSIRKFKFGKCALDDLSDNDFEEIFNDIASKLQVTPETVWNARLLRVDIGYTMSTAIPIEQIIGRVLSKPRLSRNTYKDTGVEFSGVNKKIILYDKLKELKKNKCPNLDITLEKDSVYFSSKPWANFLRIELQLKKLSGLKHQLPFISDVKSIFDNGGLRKELKDYFIKEISEIRFEHSQTIRVPDKIDRKTTALVILILMNVGKQEAEKIFKRWVDQGLLKKTVLAGIKKDFDKYENILNDEFLDYGRYINDVTLAKSDIERYNLEFKKRLDEILFG